jgi:hypothetical protein
MTGRPDPGYPDPGGEPTVPVCQPDDLAVTVRWESHGPGLRGQVVAENISARSCRLPGKPGIVPVGQDGKPLPAQTIVTMEWMSPGYVELAPGDRAAAPAGWANWCGEPASRRALVRWDGVEVVAEVDGPVQPGCEPGKPNNLTSGWFHLQR